MRQVALLQLFLVNVVIDIDCFSSRIAPEFLHEISGHAGPQQVRHEPVATAMRREPVFQSSAGFVHA